MIILCLVNDNVTVSVSYSYTAYVITCFSDKIISPTLLTNSHFSYISLTTVTFSNISRFPDKWSPPHQMYSSQNNGHNSKTNPSHMTNTTSTMHVRLLLPICTLHATDVAATDVADASPAVTKLPRRTGNTNESNCRAYLYMYITV